MVQVTVMKWGKHLKYKEMQHVPLSYSPHFLNTPFPATDTYVKMRWITVLPYRLHLRFEYWIEIVCLVSTALYSLER